MSTATADYLTSHQLCEIAGITYRQFDYWARLGVIQPVGPGTPGSGFPRRFTVDEAKVVAACARLSELGVGTMQLRRAAHDLRQLDWDGTVLVSKHGTVLHGAVDSSFGEACFVLNLGVIAQRAEAA